MVKVFEDPVPRWYKIRKTRTDDNGEIETDCAAQLMYLVVADLHRVACGRTRSNVDDLPSPLHAYEAYGSVHCAEAWFTR